METCPVNCISPSASDEDFDGAEQLYANPNICIDYGAYLEVYLALGIFEADYLPEKWRHYAQVDRDYLRARGREDGAAIARCDCRNPPGCDGCGRTHVRN
ncbi:hypothetical protein [Paraburkholderia elongata]|uniref:hypothetical protein n=1 Tax=Paraburkholderia elongata TaxID=2675747 RepID=UPI001C12E6C2|nr:hypothetical protein [Paraburkholderia elongata]